MPSPGRGRNVQAPVVVGNWREAEVDVRVVVWAGLDEDRTAQRACSEMKITEHGEEALGTYRVFV